MCFSPWGKNIPWCRNVQNALLSNMFLQQGDNVNFSLFSLHHRSHETGKSIEPSSWDANDFYPVKDCSVLFLNPRVHYMVITWRCREGAAPTETNHQVAISFLIKWLLPVFFFCMPSQSVWWEYTCVCSSSVCSVNNIPEVKEMVFGSWFPFCMTAFPRTSLTPCVFFCFFYWTGKGLKSLMVWFM